MGLAIENIRIDKWVFRNPNDQAGQHFPSRSYYSSKILSWYNDNLIFLHFSLLMASHKKNVAFHFHFVPQHNFLKRDIWEIAHNILTLLKKRFFEYLFRWINSYYYHLKKCVKNVYCWSKSYETLFVSWISYILWYLLVLMLEKEYFVPYS